MAVAKPVKCCKLIEMLRKLSADEYHDFERIAVSPYFGTGRNYAPYLKILKKHYPEFDDEMMGKNSVKRYLFELTHPGKPFSEQFMKNIFTDLIRFAEEALYQRVVRKYNHHNLIFLILEESKKNLYQLAKHNINPVSYTHLTLPTIYSV